MDKPVSLVSGLNRDTALHYLTLLLYVIYVCVCLCVAAEDCFLNVDLNISSVFINNVLLSLDPESMKTASQFGLGHQRETKSTEFNFSA